MIDSVFGTGNNYYPQVFLEECKYVVKKEVSKYIIEDIEISSDSKEKYSDKKNSAEENFDEENKFSKYIKKLIKYVFEFFFYI